MTIAAFVLALLLALLAVLLSLARLRRVTPYILSGRIEVRNECNQDGSDELPDRVNVRSRLYDRAACCVLEVESQADLDQKDTEPSMEGYYAPELEPKARFGLPDHRDAPEVLRVPGGEDVCRAILCPPGTPRCCNVGPKDPIAFPQPTFTGPGSDPCGR